MIGRGERIAAQEDRMKPDEQRPAAERKPDEQRPADERKPDEPKLADERKPDESQEHELRTKERNAGIAIAVLALLVVALFVAIFSGATDAYQP